MDWKKLEYSGGLFGCFILFTLLVRFVDRAAIGPLDSVVGLSKLNGAVRDSLGKSSIWYGISTFAGILVILIAVGFACLGAYQLIRYRSLMGVDPDIYALGVVYVIMGIFYIIFEKAVVNYRPLLENDELAASYPSSHTLLAITVIGTGVIALHKRIRDNKARNVIMIAAFALMFVAIITRTLSGVHWITDIFGAVFLGSSLIALYAALAEYSFVIRDNLRKNAGTGKRTGPDDEV